MIGDYASARPLYERALAITEQALGPEHPNTRTVRTNLAALDAPLSSAAQQIAEITAQAEAAVAAALADPSSERAALAAQLEARARQAEDGEAAGSPSNPSRPCYCSTMWTPPGIDFDDLQVQSSDAPPPAPNLPAARTDPHGDMVLIPGGEFILGGSDQRDAPPQIVELPSFYIDKTEVTNAAYKQCLAAGMCAPPKRPDSQTHPNYFSGPTYDRYPVIEVSWQQAQSFCGWAGKRLPSEAEWEKAASWNAATYQKSVWPWGDVFNPKQLNSSETGISDTSAVGQFPPERNGTVDMGGNVSEWTSSLYKPYPYNEADGRENSKASGDRVFRGGSWAQSEDKARTSSRQAASPTLTDREIGFRCAVTP